ncbi:VOC family protein [Streptomyces sp. XH2]|uniref:VOC family protein n=1 Tax=Streptomyces sp. XH2 TaxID=3412483 RepID=UPI003C7C14B2
MTAFSPGSVVWFEIGTADPEAAQGFYGSLLGWTFQAVPAAGGHPYTLITAPGAALPMGGIREPAPDGEETMCLSVRSTDVEADMARLTDLGAKPAGSVGPATDGGPCARLRDPRGTLFSVWQAAGNAADDPAGAGGAAGIPGPGSLGWFEIGTTDIEASKTFYAKAFGWDYIRDTGVRSRPYFAVVAPGHERGSGGLVDTSGTKDAEGARDYAVPQFLTADVPATIAKAKTLGATVEAGPETTAYGLTHARLTDPRGLRFLVFSLPQQS